MATVLAGNQIKLNSGKVIQAQQGGWYDGQQFWGGTLSQAGQINTQSNQQGAGQAVSQEVIAQTNPNNVAYINAQRQQQSLPPVPSVQQATPQATPTPVASTQPQQEGVSSPTAPLGQPSINLPQLYEGLYANSGIRDIEVDLSAKAQAYAQQVAKIKDNPYLSEATMTGRIKKLDEKFNMDAQNIRSDIAVKKADIETQLALQTKQFDIQSEQAQQAFQQLNSLLNIGALNSASGEDIAQFTRSTGIPSSMIYSAIEANKKSKQKEPNTQLIQSTNDAGIVTVSAINKDTGEIINQTSLGAVGNAQGVPGGSTKKEKPPTDEEATGQIIRAYLSDKHKQAQISPEDLYRELLLQYPAARKYLEENFTAKQMRQIIGN